MKQDRQDTKDVFYPLYPVYPVSLFPGIELATLAGVIPVALQSIFRYNLYRMPLHPGSLKLIPLLLALCLLLPLPARADTPPESAYVTGVPGHAQYFSLSCESRSAADWAAYWGVEISEAEFLDRLPSSDNPEVGFVGRAIDVWGSIPPHSYGVHAQPVAVLLREYGLEAEAHTGLSWDDLRAEIASGHPVIVWIIGQMWGGSRTRYTASDGQQVNVARFEHTMILTGYDAYSVYVIDAYSGASQIYPQGTFLNSWAVLDNMAITGHGEGAEQPPAESGDQEAETYTVQRGEFLIQIAERFGTTWQTLADLNRLSYPFVLYPGQVLKVGVHPAEKEAQPEQPPAPVPTPTQAPVVFQPGGSAFAILMPVIISASQPAPPPDASASEPVTEQAPEHETYQVQRGEYLIQLAERFDMDWRELAQINAIGYPYVIYPGQILKLR